MEFNSTTTMNVVMSTNKFFSWYLGTSFHFRVIIFFQYTAGHTPVTFVHNKIQWHERCFNYCSAAAGFVTHGCHKIWIATCIFAITIFDPRIYSELAFTQNNVPFQSLFQSSQIILTQIVLYGSLGFSLFFFLKFNWKFGFGTRLSRSRCSLQFSGLSFEFSSSSFAGLNSIPQRPWVLWCLRTSSSVGISEQLFIFEWFSSSNIQQGMHQ